MSETFNNEKQVTPRAMNRKELMQLYGYKTYDSLNKAIEPILHKLSFYKENRHILTTREVTYIFQHLGFPVIE